MSATSETGRAQLPRLTSLRWFAALAVFGCHFASEGHVAAWLLPGGEVGVRFFFVLSGFVLAWSMRPGQTMRQFWRARFARIYPATFASLLAGVALVRVGMPLVSVNWRSFIATATLTQSWFPGRFPAQTPNPVLWSLSCEALFYALFPALILLASRIGPHRLLLAAVAGELVVMALAAAWPGDTWYFLPAARLPEFTLGIALALLVAGGWRPRVPLLPAVGLLAAGWAAIVATPALVGVQYLPVAGVVAVLLAAVGRDLAGIRGPLTTRWLIYLGEVSFCFYLMHGLVLQTLTAAGAGIAGLVIGLPLAVGAAGLLHHGVELPMQRHILRPRGIRVTGDQIGRPQPRQPVASLHHTST